MNACEYIYTLLWRRHVIKRRLFDSVKGKYKGKGLDTSYSATYASQTRDQQRFTISEVAADWHDDEPTVLQRIMWPIHGAANRHTIAAISHSRPSPRSRSYYSFPVPLRVGG